LTGSPWSAQVVPHQYRFVFKFGSHGNGPGQLNQPFDIAVSEETGTIAVADSENKRIQLFSSDGNYLREINVKKVCTTLAFTKSGDIIAVVPSDDHKISLFAESGQFIKHINQEHLEIPAHLSVGFDGCIIACDWKNNEIRVISPDGMQLLQSFRASDRAKSLYCAVYHQDRFFVSDANANCIKVFSKEGKFLYNIGSQGTGDGQLKGPVGLAIDKFNNLIVCDVDNRRLQIFGLDGKFVTKIDKHFPKDDSAPWSVAMSNNGKVFVTDFFKACVCVFQ
ncbi:tripartite motif-containing protein 3-like, partial [Orbicella faveolata]|uniref:tripartite motif-containing protein 3-like n=1 Tax=Orbicella faveolata TaxID=48498 RepID=UPI0009E5A296